MPLVFLDRDGVIVRFPGKGSYVTRLKDFRVLPNAVKGIRLLTKAGHRLHVISNQGCVSRGLVTRAQLGRMTQLMLKIIRRGGGKISRVHYCPHQSSDRCRCKKPKTFLLKKAAHGHPGPRNKMFFIGDSEVDIQAGHRFGCRTILVLTGRSQKKDVRFFSVKPDLIKKDLYQAARWILSQRT